MLFIPYIFERNVFKNATLGEVQCVSPHCLDSKENANMKACDNFWLHTFALGDDGGERHKDSFKYQG